MQQHVQGTVSVRAAHVLHAQRPPLGTPEPGLDPRAQHGFLVGVAPTRAGDDEEARPASHAGGVERLGHAAERLLDGQAMEIDGLSVVGGVVSACQGLVFPALERPGFRAGPLVFPIQPESARAFVPAGEVLLAGSTQPRPSERRPSNGARSMKKLLLVLAFAALGVACRASGANMHDSSTCTGKDCAECTKEKMENCSDCQAKPECKEGQVCPVTGKSIN
jgi:hypothetical protein